MKYFLSILFFSLIAGAAQLSSCKKKSLNSNGNLGFSLDTLVFDTVFTTIGSTTGQFKIYNPESKSVTIEQVELMGGNTSPFSLNLDGIKGTSFGDITVEGKDSLFCFVEVTLNVNGGTLPLIIEDSIRFRTNGTDQYVKLAVWGQDAYFHYHDVNTGTWPNDKPHVVYDYAGIDEGQTLNIQAGTNVFLHKGSAIYVFRGTLNVNGTKESKVTFQGDRLEPLYKDVPGQYYGVYFDSARPSTINYAVIKNAIAGVHVESSNPAFTGQTTVKVTNTEIYNCASYGMLLYDFPKIEAENTLIHHNGVQALIVLQGADFKFTHCNLLGYGTGQNTTPAVGLLNFFTQEDQTTTIRNIKGEFNNCVIYGTTEEELVINTLTTGNPSIDFIFRNCLIRSKSLASTTSPIYDNCYFNLDPLFMTKFMASSNSPLNNKGTGLYSLPMDILGNTRSTGPGGHPDIGVYEFN